MSSQPPSPSPLPSSYAYPYASAPDIIRAHQKDAYFQETLAQQITSILRPLIGARTTHNYTTETHTLAEFLYLTLTTIFGNRTLGEEYCDVLQVETRTGRVPNLRRRVGYVLSAVLVPYVVTKGLPTWKRLVRRWFEVLERRRERGMTVAEVGGKMRLRMLQRRLGWLGSQSKFLRKIEVYVRENLDTIMSPSSVHAVSLALFYLTGAYYQLSKRVWGLRYIFTWKVPDSDQRGGYEVLGVLLALQLSVQAWLHFEETVGQAVEEGQDAPLKVVAGKGDVTARRLGEIDASLDAKAYTRNNALLLDSSAAAKNSMPLSNISRITHTPVQAPRINENSDLTLANKEVMAWMSSPQQRKCTLCLEPMRYPSVTVCGHTFCWDCIIDWCREKPECPLCRQECLAQHVLVLRN